MGLRRKQDDGPIKFETEPTAALKQYQPIFVKDMVQRDLAGGKSGINRPAFI
jgi:hypothetical protein